MGFFRWLALVALLALAVLGSHVRTQNSEIVALKAEIAKSVETKASIQGFMVAGIQPPIPGADCDVFVFSADGVRKYLARIQCPSELR